MLVGINTKGIGPMDLGTSGRTKVKEQVDKKAAEAFSSLMSLNQNTPSAVGESEAPRKGLTEVKSEFSAGAAPEVKPADAGVAVGKEAGVKPSEKNASEKNVSEKKPAEKPAAKEESVKTEDKTVEKKGVEKAEKNTADRAEEPTDPAVSQQFVAAANQLADELKELFDLTDEELAGLLEENGLSMVALLQPDTLKSFVLTIQDASEVDLLINEELNTTVNNLLADLQEITEEFELPENFELPRNPESFDAVLTETLEERGAEAVLTEQPEQPVVAKRQELVSEKMPEKTNEPKVAEKEIQTEQPAGESAVSEKPVTAENTFDQGFAQNGEQSSDTVAVNLAQAIQQVAGEQNISGGEFVDAVSQADILRQVVDEIRVNMSKEVTSLTIKLNPEQLGNVHITVSSKDGSMQARIIAENEAAKNAIESSVALLKETFENQDLKVDEIEVMVGTGEFFEEMEQQAQSEDDGQNAEKRVGGINLTSISDDEVSEENELEVEMMKASGNSVSYMA